MTTTIARAFPLGLLLALSACGDTDKDKTPVDSDTNAGTETDTGDTGEPTGPTSFEPNSIQYSAIYALDEDAAPRTVVLGSEIGSYFQIELSDDSGDTCTLVYFLHDDQFAYAGQAAGTDTDADSDVAPSGNADVLEWLDAHGASFGWRVGSGGYDQGSVNDPADRCADIDLDAFNAAVGGTYADIYEAALQLGGTGTMFFGNNTSPTGDVLMQFEGSGIDEDDILGGVITLPFALGTDGDTFDSAGLWADIGDDGAPANDGTNYTFNPAADAFDDATLTPAPGFYEFIAGVGISFTNE